MAYENIKDFYRARMKEGYKLHEIDEMDIHFFFELYQKDNGKPEVKRGFIDQVL